MTSRAAAWSATVLLVLISAPILAASAQDLETKKSFEGVMEVQLQNNERVDLYSYSVKDGRIRVESVGREGAPPIGLVDLGAKKLYVILPAREQYIEVPYGVASSEAQLAGGGWNVQKTESTDELLGYSCDQFIVKSTQREIEVWATKELGTAGTFLTGMTVQSLDVPHWQTEILSLGYFPLKAIERDSSGNELATLMVNSVKKKTLGESLFRVPTDYEKVDRDALQPKQAVQKKRTR